MEDLKKFFHSLVKKAINNPNIRKMHVNTLTDEIYVLIIKKGNRNEKLRITMDG